MAIQSGPEDRESHTRIAKVYELVGKREEAHIELETDLTSPVRGPASLEEMIDSIESPAP